MSDPSSTSKTPEEVSTPHATFQHQSLDHLTVVNYERPSPGQGERIAYHFFGGTEALATELATAKSHCAAAREQLSIMHKQSMHLSQTLSAVQMNLASLLEKEHGRASGSFPFLAPYNAVPLVKKYIRLPCRLYVSYSHVVAAIHTNDPSAMAVVYASDVIDNGFTLHADLVNHADFAGRAELLLGVITWIAV